MPPPPSRPAGVPQSPRIFHPRTDTIPSRQRDRHQHQPPRPPVAPGTSADGNKPLPALTGGTEKLSVTDHELRIGDEVLKYRATAGFMVMKDEEGKVKANVFFMAYEKTPAPDAGK